MKTLLAFLLSLTALAQSPTPEIRGSVIEFGTRAPLAGAIVTLYEFAPDEDNLLVRKAVATTATGPDGTFSFKPGRFGRVISASGGPDIKTLGPVQIAVVSSGSLPSPGTFAQTKDGKFTITKIPWQSHHISVRVPDADTYVKEVRYNGLPLRTHELEASSGGELDIIVDRGAASLSLTLKKGDVPTGGLVFLAPASLAIPPALRSQFEPFTFMGQTNGTFPITFKNVSPGDYRLYVGEADLKDFAASDAETFTTRFQQPAKLTLEHGEQKSIELQLKR